MHSPDCVIQLPLDFDTPDVLHQFIVIVSPYPRKNMMTLFIIFDCIFMLNIMSI